MLRSVKQLRGCTIRATDGDAGKLHESYFDGHQWNVCYVVVSAGNWLTRRRVLISPSTLGRLDENAEVLPANLTKTQVENSPPAYLERAASHQVPGDIPHAYYRWPYWRLAAPGFGLRPVLSAWLAERRREQGARPGEQPDVPHLQSTRDVIGCRAGAKDGEVGRVEDLLLDDDAWRIPYIVVVTPGLLAKNRYLVAPPWIDQVSGSRGKIQFDLPRETIENSPPFDPSGQVSREFEIRLLEHYGGRSSDSERD